VKAFCLTTASAFSEARPGWVSRLICRWPLACMAVILFICAGACVVPFLRPPSIDTSFDSFTIQNQPIHNAMTSSGLIASGSSTFWSKPPNNYSISSTAPLSADALALNSVPALRRLAANPNELIRASIGRTIHVVFHLTNKTTLLTPAAIQRVKSVEDKVFALPAYQTFCLHALAPKAPGVRVCRRPVSVTNFVYASVTADGWYVPDGKSDVQQDPVKAAQVGYETSS
jgi:hypothetical protein